MNDIIIPDFLPPLPPLPLGFDRWVYRGEKYKRDDPYMWTSYEVGTDQQWDPPCFSNSSGYPHTYYLEAVINHHKICNCDQCRFEQRILNVKSPAPIITGRLPKIGRSPRTANLPAAGDCF